MSSSPPRASKRPRTSPPWPYVVGTEPPVPTLSGMPAEVRADIAQRLSLLDRARFGATCRRNRAEFGGADRWAIVEQEWGTAMRELFGRWLPEALAALDGLDDDRFYADKLFGSEYLLDGVLERMNHVLIGRNPWTGSKEAHSIHHKRPLFELKRIFPHSSWSGLRCALEQAFRVANAFSMGIFSPPESFWDRMDFQERLGLKRVIDAWGRVHMPSMPQDFGPFGPTEHLERMHALVQASSLAEVDRRMGEVFAAALGPRRRLVRAIRTAGMEGLFPKLQAELAKDAEADRAEAPPPPEPAVPNLPPPNPLHGPPAFVNDWHRNMEAQWLDMARAALGDAWHAHPANANLPPPSYMLGNGVDRPRRTTFPLRP